MTTEEDRVNAALRRFAQDADFDTANYSAQLIASFTDATYDVRIYHIDNQTVTCYFRRESANVVACISLDCETFETFHL